MMKPADRSEVSEDNYIPVDKDKLKEDQQKELREHVDKYKRECLKSCSINRSGEVVKKFDFPALQPLTEAQRENKMIDMVVDAKIDTLESEGKCSSSSEK
jgi:hypothetical protein